MEYYNLLNLPFDATEEEIRAAYFKAARKYHPDASIGAVDGKIFISIQKAYEVLSDEKRRKAYDKTVPKQVKEKSSVNLEKFFSRQSIQRSIDPQLLYVLLNIGTTESVDVDDRPPIHLCIILDRSTSMRGERMDMVQQNLRQLIKWLKPDDVISLVGFSDRAEVLLEPTECKNTNLIESRIHAINTGGATEIYYGLELGFELFKRFSGKSNHTRNLILITDGHTYGDEDRCLQLVERANLDGVVFNAIGIGNEWNDVFLDRLSSLSGGNTVYIRDAHELRRFSEGKIRSLSSNFARKAELYLELPENVELNYAFRIQPDVSPLDTILPIQIGTVEYNRKTSVILEFNIKGAGETADKINIADGKILLDISTKPIPVERHFIHFELPIIEQTRKEVAPPDVLNAMSKISLYRLQEKAKEKVREGDIEGATRHLKYLATRLITQGENQLAGQALAEMEHLQNYGSFSSDGEKIIKYGTRSLFMLPGPELTDNDQVS